MAFSRLFRILVMFSLALAWASSCFGQASAEKQDLPGTTPSGQPTGSITGTVIDPSGAVVAGGDVTLSEPGQPNRRTKSGDHGQFSFSNVPPGTFQLTIEATGFERQTFSGTVEPGGNDDLLPIMLSITEAITSVQVGVPQSEVAREQLKVEEQQRVLGVVPNFYVSYVPNAAPLDAKQKFQLALRTVIDPYTLIVVGAIAGVQQEQGHFQAYGPGPAGYGKRFGANFADTVSGTFLGGAVFASLFKQDPRYFYKGTGSTVSRLYYAISRAVICKGDNKRWQPNYSEVLGDLAGGGISNLYYPANDRQGAGLTFANAAIGLAGDAATNVIQEFIVPKFMPKHKKEQNKPQPQSGSGD